MAYANAEIKMQTQP